MLCGKFKVSFSNLFISFSGTPSQNLLFHRQLAKAVLSMQKTAFSSMFAAKPTPAILSLQPESPNWRESTSLIITAKDSSSEESSEKFNYSVLMVKRSGGSSFMPSTFVFPGGRVELSDFDSKWYSLYAKLTGLQQAALDESIRAQDISGPRPPIVTSPLSARELVSSGQAILNPEIALRITAIRETFEEAGILLLTPHPEQPHKDDSYAPVQLSGSDLSTWQLRVRNDGSTFLDLCQSLQMVPNIWALYEWTNWLTPTNNHKKRYDTIFYVVCLQSGRPDVQVDNAEVTKPIVSLYCFTHFSQTQRHFLTIFCCCFSGQHHCPYWRNTTERAFSWHRLKSGKCRGCCTFRPYLNCNILPGPVRRKA